MKKISVFSLLLICLGNGFSQKLIRDNFSGMEMELCNNNKYLRVIKLISGSPADLSFIKPGDIILRIDEKNIGEINHIENYFENNNKTVKIGLENGKEFDIPRVTINLFSDNYMTECELFSKIVIFQIKEICSNNTFMNPREEYEIFDEKFQTVKNPQAYNIETYASSSSGMCKRILYNPKLNYYNHNQVTILADGTTDISAINTFDFDYLSQADPLMEKTLLNKLEDHLTKLGLTRNTENPDILILINFYSGQKDNYVPPQQIVSTKIKTYFNWYWGYIPVPVAETKMKSGYTETNYLINISLKFLDAHRIENSKVPPVIWNGSYSEIGPKKVFINDAADDIYELLLFHFPFLTDVNSENLRINNFTNTGLIFDKNNMNKIADVIPGSAADKAGIKKGDLIYLNGKKDWKWDDNNMLALSDDCDLAYLFYGSNLMDGDSRYFKPLFWHNNKFRQSLSQPIIFSGKRNNEKLKFEVIPEYVKGIFFDKNPFVFK